MNLNDTPTLGPLTERDLDARQAEWPRRTAAFAGLTYQGRLDEPARELERQAEQARMAGVDDDRDENRPARGILLSSASGLLLWAVLLVACAAAVVIARHS